MGGEGEKINVLDLHINGQMPRCLHGVGVEQHAPVTAQPADFGDGLNGADFVVGEHDGDQCGVFPECLGHLTGENDSAFRGGQQRDGKALAFQLL